MRRDSPVTPDDRFVANYLRSIIGSKPSVVRFGDDEDIATVDVAEFQDAPTAGASTAATLNLSNTSIALSIDDKPLRVELLISYYIDCDFGRNIISTCAFNVIKGGSRIEHGAIFPRIVELYYPNISMKHIMFSSPYEWQMETQELPSKLIAWLLAVPISDAERAYALANGTKALGAFLESRAVDVMDVFRVSSL